MNAHRVVGRDRPVDEAEARTAGVLLAEPLERPICLPAREHVGLERRMVGDKRKRRERAWHPAIVEGGRETAARPFRVQNRGTAVRTRRKRPDGSCDRIHLRAQVLQSSTPVVVDFWAEWCGPCHAVAPVLERIVDERDGELKLVKVNIDEEQELALRYGVMSTDDDLFRDGEPAAAVYGRAAEGRDRASARPRADRRIASALRNGDAHRGEAAPIRLPALKLRARDPTASWGSLWKYAASSIGRRVTVVKSQMYCTKVGHVRRTRPTPGTSTSSCAQRAKA